MYFKVESRKNEFKHDCNSKLIMGIAVSERRAILFYANGKFFDYDLFEKKIVYSSSLGERPFKGVAVNPKEIVCMLADSRRVIAINIARKEIAEVCRLPLHSTHDEVRDRNIFFLSSIHSFKLTRSFYIEENNEDDNKKRIVYFPDSPSYKDNHLMREYDSAGLIFEPMDQSGRLAVYRQHPEPDKKWQLRIVNLAANFEELKYSLEHRAFTGTCLIEQVWAKSDQQILIFVNGSNPQILLLDLEKTQLTEFPLKLGKNFRSICFYNPDSQVACLTYLANVRIKGQLYENSLELVDMQKATVIERAHATLKDYSAGWENDYLLDIAAENRTGNVSIFHTRHFIKKKSMYFYLLARSGVLDKYGHGMCKALELLG